MNSKRRKRVRILGKILFVLYIGFIIYFLLFSDLYGRTGQLDTYHYNLSFLKKSRDFGTTEIGWDFCYVYKSIRKCGDFCSVRFLYAYGQQIQKLLFYVILQLRAEPVCRDVPIAYEGGKL